MGELTNYQAADNVATIIMDDGKVNALSVAMLAEINAALDQAEGAKAAVVLAGREGRFSGGFDLGVFRVGHEQYAEDNGTHGVATLLCEHLSVRGDRVRFRFPAKHGVEVDEEITDPQLARAVRTLLKDQTPDCRVFELTADDINERFRELVGEQFSAKDLRTWHATVRAAQAFAHALRERGKPSKRAISTVMKEVADHLGNTAAVARKSYVDPRLTEAFERGEVIGNGDPERAVRKLLTR